MAYTQTYMQVATVATGQIIDPGIVTIGDTIVSLAPSTVVPANGAAANDVVAAFPATGFQSMILLATVPCVVTFSGVSQFDGVAGTPTADDVTLVANVTRRIAAITGACTAISIGANTTGAGAAGTIQISVLYNA